MQVHILASGSTGNAVYFQFGKARILVDAGISARRIERGLAEIGVRGRDLDAVLITHEHQDHIQGLDVFIRRYQIPVYARERAWAGIKCSEKFPRECCQYITAGFDLGPIRVEPFSISHDAADPVGYAFYYGQRKWVMATDLGMITPGVEKAMAGADLLVLESNHDVDMLVKGPYPLFLKQRIRSSKGHLSNLDAGQVLARLPRQRPMQVFLAHLSQKNNNPRLAYQTVSAVLQQFGCLLGDEIQLNYTHPDHTASYIAR